MSLKAELNLLRRAKERMLGEKEAEARAREALAAEVRASERRDRSNAERSSLHKQLLSHNLSFTSQFQNQRPAYLQNLTYRSVPARSSWQRRRQLLTSCELR